MMIQQGISLQEYNTFGIDAQCNTALFIESKDDVHNHRHALSKAIILGGGSNILLTKSQYDIVAINQISHIEICKENREDVIVSIGSGKNWHETVLWAIDHHLGGIENLSLIPGTVGAGPIQNIGAYGCELKDVLVGLDFYDFDLQAWRYMSVSDCHLGYRDSIFKHELKNKGFIGTVYLRLTKEGYHQVNTQYSALQSYLSEKNIDIPNIEEVSNAVIAVRQSKLPNWKELGNAGSFFKNPVIHCHQLQHLQEDYPKIPSYPIDTQTAKVPAAWLIQECGFKGVKRGAVGCYKYQPLVIVNHGGGSGEDVINLKNEIQIAVYDRFQIQLQPEVTIL
ncbi:UDP-N-acetylmuramate dehydrogenase [Membranihabitans marinus]|uniref:UDP-N-acetylmuramate dehydrogenase n=1 Tax=Membranihabitans marinus TaxID=1227546 RepID=UPI001F01F5B4|nr:UDP-N-acetylmuramate dehydrogenase [Membranihabitans marinus]